MIPGNHDVFDEGSIHHRFTVSDRCANVQFIDAPEGRIVEIPGTDVVVWGRAMPEHEPDFRPLTGLPPQPMHRWSIAAGHGLIMDGDEPTYRSSPIYESDLAAVHWDYVALGHIHRYSVVRDDPTPRVLRGRDRELAQRFAGCRARRLRPRPRRATPLGLPWPDCRRSLRRRVPAPPPLAPGEQLGSLRSPRRRTLSGPRRRGYQCQLATIYAAIPRNSDRLPRMMRRCSSSENDFSCAPTYSDGEGEPFAVGEVGAEDDRLDPDLGDDALHVLLGEGRDQEVAAEDLARARSASSRPTSPCGPSGTRGPSCAGCTATTPCPVSDRHTRMFGNRPKKLCRIMPGGQLHRGTVTPVHDPLERVEPAEGDLGILAPVGAVLLVVGAPEVHGDAHARPR